MAKAKVLIFVVEDEQLVREMLQDALVENGFAVENAESGQEAIRLLDTNGHFTVP